MAFTVGMKVVCVDDKIASHMLPIVLGTIYSIRAIHLDDDGDIGFALNEIRNPQRMTSDAGITEPFYLSTRFRPVVSRKTDISVFTAMLNPSPVTVDAMKIADVAREIAE